MIAKFIYIIYCTSIKEGHFPMNLKNVYMAEVYESGQMKKLPIIVQFLLTNHISKILERVVRKDIIKYMDDNDMSDKRQHGSRKGGSTLSYLLQNQDNILRAME